jgi:Ca2+-binding RTX toxin-like protein
MRVGNDANGLQTERTMNLALAANLTPKVGVLDYVNVYGTNGPDTLQGSPYGFDTHIDAGGGNGNVYGGSGNDTVWGGAGNDMLDGGAGRDTLYGGDDNDSLYGGVGNDKLFGDAGNDVIYGGLDVDQMYGGSGADSFTFGDIRETGAVSTGFGVDKDMIGDFNPSEGDTIDLVPLAHVEGFLPFSFDSAALNGGHPAPGHVGWDYAADHTNFNIWINTYHGEAVISVQNTGHGTPDASWFHLG